MDTYGPLNVPTKEEDTDMEKPNTQKCVGKYYNNDISMKSSKNMGSI